MARWGGAQWRPLRCNFERGGNQPRLLVLHVMQGTLAGTDGWFRNSRAEVSAHFGVGKDGVAYQWVDTADQAWHAADANSFSIGIENEGWAGEALTSHQLHTVAAIAYWASRHHGIPLQVCDDPAGRGLAWHGLGGAAWGNHPDCPGGPIVAQRPAIITAAKGGSSMSTTGPESWDQADWDAIAQHIWHTQQVDVAGQAHWPSWVLSQLATGALPPAAAVPPGGAAAAAPTAQEIAQAVIAGLPPVPATEQPPTAEAIAAAVLAALPPAAAGGLTAGQLQAAAEAGLRAVLAKAAAA